MISNNSTYNKYMYLKDIKTINSDEFTQKELETYLKKNGEILYIKKLTTSKTLVYLLLKNKRAAKIILHKKKKIPIAIIPWKIPLFVTTQKLSYSLENKYKVVLFPDCYLETNSKGTLTKIFNVTDVNNIITLPYTDILFDTLFSLAWEMWKLDFGKYL